MVASSSLYTPAAMVCAWLFMAMLPLDCSHAGTNGLLTRMYPHDRQGTHTPADVIVYTDKMGVYPSLFSVSLCVLSAGEVQGVLEQIATLAVIGGYPGSLLFGYFVDDDAPFFWPGAAYSLAAAYSLVAAALFYWHIYQQSDGVNVFPYENTGMERSDGKTLLEKSEDSDDSIEDASKEVTNS